MESVTLLHFGFLYASKNVVFMSSRVCWFGTCRLVLFWLSRCFTKACSTRWKEKDYSREAFSDQLLISPLSIISNTCTYGSAGSLSMQTASGFVFQSCGWWGTELNAVMNIQSFNIFAHKLKKEVQDWTFCRNLMHWQPAWRPISCKVLHLLLAKGVIHIFQRWINKKYATLWPSNVLHL